MFLSSDFLKFNVKITQFSMETSSLFSSELRKALQKTESNVCEKRRETVRHEISSINPVHVGIICKFSVLS